MLSADLERYLHEHIPLSKAMQVSVRSIETDTVVLQAPLKPNINHRETVFGGSASALALLAGWSLLHLRLQRESLAGRLVIQRNSMQYLQPIRGDFTARATLEQPDAWPSFMRTLVRRGRARIAVGSSLEHSGEVVGTFTGEFVALRDQAS